MSSKLDEICAKKREHIAAQKTKRPLSYLVSAAKNITAPRGFKRALQKKVAAGEFGLIAELKKASPSKGLIRENFEAPELAKAYATGGAACLSVLTDEPYFQGHDHYMVQTRAVVKLPVLRKDFMLDPYQIVESRALGADCILLIIAALEDAQAQELEDYAMELGMDVLVEVHSEAELERALRLSSRLIGINNRDLKTLKVDISTSQRLAKHMPADSVLVCESGISTHDDLERMKQVGISCFLVGESLMRQEDVTEATKKLLGGHDG